MKDYKIIKDPEYGFLRADPVPTEEEVEKYYLEEFYSANYKNFNNSTLQVQKDDKDFFDARWEGMYNNFQLHFDTLNDKALFDIGFGFAQALLYFRDQGLRVSGIEPSPEGVKYAESKGLNVYKGGIEDFRFADGNKYDIVTLINVLEHLRNPFQTIKNIKEKLLTDGGLLVIDVPNEFNDFQVIANTEYNLKQWWVCPPNHINYFSPTSLSNILEKAGFRTILKESSFPMEMFMLFGDVYVGNPTLGKECHKKRMHFEKMMQKHGKYDKMIQFYRHLAELDLGRNIIIYSTPQ